MNPQRSITAYGSFIDLPSHTPERRRGPWVRTASLKGHWIEVPLPGGQCPYERTLNWGTITRRSVSIWHSSGFPGFPLKTRAELECSMLESPDFDLVAWEYKFCLNSKCGYLGEIIAYGFSLLVCEVGTITDYHIAYPIGLLPGSNWMLSQPSYSIVIDNFDLASWCGAQREVVWVGVALPHCPRDEDVSTLTHMHIWETLLGEKAWKKPWFTPLHAHIHEYSLVI